MILLQGLEMANICLGPYSLQWDFIELIYFGHYDQITLLWGGRNWHIELIVFLELL